MSYCTLHPHRRLNKKDGKCSKCKEVDHFGVNKYNNKQCREKHL